MAGNDIKLEKVLRLLLELSNKPYFLYVNEVKEIAKLIHEVANDEVISYKKRK